MFSCITRITVIGAPTSFRRIRDVDPTMWVSTHLLYFLSVRSTLTFENGPASVISSACLKNISSLRPYWIIISWIGSLKALFMRVPSALTIQKSYIHGLAKEKGRLTLRVIRVYQAVEFYSTVGNLAQQVILKFWTITASCSWLNIDISVLDIFGKFFGIPCGAAFWYSLIRIIGHVIIWLC